MKWFEPIIIIIAILLVIIPIILHFKNKKNNTLKCECGHYQKDCINNCSLCSLDKEKLAKNKGPYTYILMIKNMRCGSCETHINDIIRKNFKVSKVRSNRRKNQTIIISESLLSFVDVKKAINDSGYIVSSMKLK